MLVATPVIDMPDVRERPNGIAFVAAPGTPQDCEKVMRGQIETLTNVVRDAGLRPK